jgi:hypothetical protein
MNRVENNLADVRWVAQCAHRLRERSHADVVTLEEAAWKLSRDEEHGSLAPTEAVVRWLAPLADARDNLAPACCGRPVNSIARR